MLKIGIFRRTKASSPNNAYGNHIRYWFWKIKEVKVDDSINFDESLCFKPFRSKNNQNNVVLHLFIKIMD